MNDEQSSYISVTVSDTETGEQTDIVIDSDGNQVHLGDQVDDETQGLLDNMGKILAGGEEPDEDDLDRGH